MNIEFTIALKQISQTWGCFVDCRQLQQTVQRLKSAPTSISGSRMQFCPSPMFRTSTMRRGSCAKLHFSDISANRTCRTLEQTTSFSPTHFLYALYFQFCFACIGRDQRSYSTLGPVSAWMGDRLRAGKLSRYVTTTQVN